MHRNTQILVVLLGILAATVAGINLGRPPQQPQETVQLVTPTAIPTPTIQLQTFTNPNCAIAFQYTGAITKVDIESGGSTLSDLQGNALTVLCQASLTRPREMTNAEPYNIGTVSALLLQPDATSAAQPRLFFRHPQTRKNISITGTPSLFAEMLTTITLE